MSKKDGFVPVEERLSFASQGDLLADLRDLAEQRLEPLDRAASLLEELGISLLQVRQELPCGEERDVRDHGIGIVALA